MGALRRHWWAAGLAIVALVVVAAALLASADPDGFERVAETLGLADRSEEPGYQLLPDYTIPGVEDPVLSTILAGLAGVALVFVAVVALGRLLRSRRSD